MADEKKEELKNETKAPEAPAAPQQPAAGSPAPAEAVQAAPAAAVAKEEKKEASPVVKEKPANCAGCKKSIKNKRWYYRNGKYYCTKRCWSTANKKPAKAEAAPQ
jgi:hypothetical protein